MGKSPGKWIKTVLFGKKYSKSNFSKNTTPDKRTTTTTHVQDPSQNPPVISNPYPLTEETLELERGASEPQCDTIALSPVNQGADSPNEQVALSLSDADTRRQNEAAAKMQAAFRGYLARRAFQALKGIIRLQALVRGHLVRRQAVATLRCMRAIVKIQAIARGLKVGIGGNVFLGSQKLATSIFVRKLLVKIPNDKPLSIQYDVADSNSSWSWLERWSGSHIWEPPVRAKKTIKPKPQRKMAESEAGKSKRTIRKAPTPSNGENGSLASEADKPRRNPWKLTAQEQTTSEVARLECDLGKVSSSTSVLVPELDTENQIVEVSKTSSPHDAAPDLEIAVSPEKMVNADGVVDYPGEFETPLKNEPGNVPLDDNPALETEYVENGVKIESGQNLDNGNGIKDEKTSNEKTSRETQKIKKRRSLPARQEFTEKKSQNSPSYMAATESAKAKLRAQAKFEEDGGAEYGGNARRHSLPSSTNGRLSSSSPRVQKHNGKGVSKYNMATMASKDDKAVLPVGWRR